MGSSDAEKSIDRTLKDISSTLKGIEKALRTLNQNYVDTARSEPPKVLPRVYGWNPRVYGWNAAASVQLHGGLVVGDMKYEHDESLWVWTGDIWERVELPSEQKG